MISRLSTQMKIVLTGLLIIIGVLVVGLCVKEYNFYLSPQVRQVKDTAKFLEYVTASNMLINENSKNTEELLYVLKMADKNCPSFSVKPFNTYKSLIESDIKTNTKDMKSYRVAYTEVMNSLNNYMQSNGIDLTSTVYQAGQLLNQLR